MLIVNIYNMYRFIFIRIILLWDVSIVRWREILNILRNILVSLLNKLLNVYNLVIIIITIIMVLIMI